jgi:hypothetical protein
VRFKEFRTKARWRRAAPLHHHEALRRPLSIDALPDECRSWPPSPDGSTKRFRTTAPLTLYGETGTGTAMLMRQLESEVRVRGGLFAMAASHQLGRATTIWSLVGIAPGTNRSPINPPQAWKELHHLEPTFGQPADASAPTGSQYRLLGELTSYIRARRLSGRW